jgi:hypothetical protein
MLQAALLSLLTAGCMSPSGKHSTTTGPVNTQSVSGAWVLNKGWMGFMGIAYRFDNGNFEYWFMSDFSGPDRPSYPIRGTYSVKDGKISLVSQQKTYADKWRVFQEKGNLCLIADEDFQNYANGKSGYAWKLLYPDPLFDPKDPFNFQWR